MIRPSNLYFNYQITNKLICKVIVNNFGSKWELRINLNRYLLNRTNKKYWNSNVELIELKINSTHTYKELSSLRKQIITHLNIIYKCIYNVEYKKINDIEIVIN